MEQKDTCSLVSPWTSQRREKVCDKWQQPHSQFLILDHHTLNAWDGGLGMRPELHDWFQLMGSLRPGNETAVMQAVSLWAVSDLGTRLRLCNQFQLMGSLRPGNETVHM